MVGIINYGMGNLKSVYNAIEYVGGNAIICNTVSDLDKVKRIIIPGVGAFGMCIENLRQAEFFNELTHLVQEKGMPTLGICVGMQIMASKGFEGGEHTGLNWFDATVDKINNQNNTLKIPNIGWTEMDINNNHPLFNKIAKNPVFYLVHSYFMKCNNAQDVMATYVYGETITAAICKNNIAATQFHPEKSQDVGLQFLENFLKWEPN
jgi:imidazole glycerol-phosphate synthase subunit HisH